MGLPIGGQDDVKLWSDEILMFQGVNRPSEAVLERSQKALLAMRSYLTDLVNEGSRLTEQELVWTCIQLLGAGHETTTSLNGNGLYTILSHAEEWEKLLKNPPLVNSAIEAMLRYESPVARQLVYSKTTLS